MEITHVGILSGETGYKAVYGVIRHSISLNLTSQFCYLPGLGIVVVDTSHTVVSETQSKGSTITPSIFPLGYLGFTRILTSDKSVMRNNAHGELEAVGATPALTHVPSSSVPPQWMSM